MDEYGQIEVPYVNVRLVTGVMSQITKPVLAHEIPILMTSFGEENVTTLGATGDTRWCDPGEEYARLTKRYGANKSGQALSEEVFGKSMEGRLSGLMDRSLEMFPLPSPEEIAEEEAKKAPVQKKAVKKGRKRLKSKPTD